VIFVDPTGRQVAWLNAGLEGAQSYQQGTQAISSYQQQLNCAYNTGSGCTVNDQAVNNAGQQQSQALQSLGHAGAQAGSAAYSGQNAAGVENGFSQFVDNAITALNPTAVIGDIKTLISNLGKLFAPQAQAAGPPSAK
jgi:hypothetical protein